MLRVRKFHADFGSEGMSRDTATHQGALRYFILICNTSPSLCDEVWSLVRESMRRCELITLIGDGVGLCNSHPIIVLRN
jgi:hypothetical protein